MIKKILIYVLICYSFECLSQNKIDSILHLNNKTNKIIILDVIEAPYNIINLIKRSFPDLKFKSNEKTFFSYFKQDSTYFSVGRMNTQNNNLKEGTSLKSGILNGKILLPYQIKYYKNYVIIIISESNKFPISFE